MFSRYSRFDYRFARVSFFVVVVMLGACQQEKAKPLNVSIGQAFPALNVQDMQGNKHELNFLGDKVTILNIWATWCGPCRHEMPSLQRLSDILDEKKYQVIGVSVDDDSHIAQEYLIDKKIKFTNYVDPSMDVANVILGIRAYPSTFVINEEGVLMFVEEKWRYWDELKIIERIKTSKIK